MISYNRTRINKIKYKISERTTTIAHQCQAT
jgi:hypothetical protein